MGLDGSKPRIPCTSRHVKLEWSSLFSFIFIFFTPYSVFRIPAFPHSPVAAIPDLRTRFPLEFVIQERIANPGCRLPRRCEDNVD